MFSHEYFFHFFSTIFFRKINLSFHYITVCGKFFRHFLSISYFFLQVITSSVETKVLTPVVHIHQAIIFPDNICLQMQIYIFVGKKNYAIFLYTKPLPSQTTFVCNCKYWFACKKQSIFHTLPLSSMFTSLTLFSACWWLLVLTFVCGHLTAGFNHNSRICRILWNRTILESKTNTRKTIKKALLNIRILKSLRM